jgi:hypothetical protein
VGQLAGDQHEDGTQQHDCSQGESDHPDPAELSELHRVGKRREPQPDHHQQDDVVHDVVHAEVDEDSTERPDEPPRRDQLYQDAQRQPAIVVCNPKSRWCHRSRLSPASSGRSTEENYGATSDLYVLLTGLETESV